MSRWEDRLDAELRFHFDSQVADNIRAGMSEREARRQARLTFGGLDQVKEECRDARTTRWLETALQDLRFAVRALRKSPAFTLTSILTLALGIGANTAIFTIVNTVLLHPLPYPHSDRIVDVSRTVGSVSVPMFVFWDRADSGLIDLSAYKTGTNSSLAGGEGPELISTNEVSEGYFRLFGARPILGRTFAATEDRPGGASVLVMSYGFWKRRFGGDPAILRQSVTLGGTSYRVIGVLAAGFQPYPAADVWTPLQADPNSTDQAHYLLVAGRLPEGMTLTQANTRMAAIGTLYAQTGSQQLGNDDKLQVTSLQERMTGAVRPALLLLLGAVGLVLLIACANVASLQLARSSQRNREIAIRAAIGAGRRRIIRQLLTESILLALCGGVVGLGLGLRAIQFLITLTPGDLPRAQEMTSIPTLDLGIAGFNFALAMITGILFGLLPAFQLSRTEVIGVLKNSGGHAASGVAQGRARRILVAGEVSIAIVLLCGAFLLMRSFVAIGAVDVGFEAHNLLAIEVARAGAGFSKATDMDLAARQLVSRVEQIPGVEFAAMASSLPLLGRMDMVFSIPGRPPSKGYRFTGDAQWRIVSTHYFDTLKIPILAGRSLREGERAVLISQTMAREYWPNANPLGQTMVIGDGLGPTIDQGPVQVVGVVGDVRDRLNLDPGPIFYEVPTQIPDGVMPLANFLPLEVMLIRTRRGIAAGAIRRAVQQAVLESNELLIAKVRSIEQVRLDSTARQNFNLLMLGLFAASALALAAVGLYGVMSNIVLQRTREIGVRMALGATRRDTVRLVLKETLRMTTAGIAIGIAASFGVTRLLRAQLFGVSPLDPVTFVAVPSVLLAIALIATLIPARRATRIDPVEALRWE